MINIEQLESILKENVMIFKDVEEENNEATIYTVTIENSILTLKRELEDSGFDFDDFEVNMTEYKNVAKDLLKDISIQLANINNNYTLVEK